MSCSLSVVRDPAGSRRECLFQAAPALSVRCHSAGRGRRTPDPGPAPRRRARGGRALARADDGSIDGPRGARPILVVE